MRLLYVAMTRAEKKLYLVGKGSREKLEAKEYPAAKNGKLNSNTRLQAKGISKIGFGLSVKCLQRIISTLAIVLLVKIS